MPVERQFVTDYYDKKIVRASEEDATEIEWIYKRVKKISMLLSDIDQWIYLRESKALTSLELVHKDVFSPVTRLTHSDRFFVASALLTCSRKELIEELIEVLKEVHNFDCESDEDNSPKTFDRD